jgi:hypothetical protein
VNLSLKNTNQNMSNLKNTITTTTINKKSTMKIVITIKMNTKNMIIVQIIKLRDNKSQIKINEIYVE